MLLCNYIVAADVIIKCLQGPKNNPMEVCSHPFHYCKSRINVSWTGISIILVIKPKVDKVVNTPPLPLLKLIKKLIHLYFRWWRGALFWNAIT